MAETEVKRVFTIDTSKGEKSIKSLRKELKAFKDEMANVEEGSDEFYKIADAAGKVQHQIQEISQTVRGAGSDFGDMLSNGIKSSQGLIGGFQSVTATMSLMGIESESVEKALTKMTALLNIQQGISAIDEGIKSFKKLKTAILAASAGMSALKKALISTGLGTLVVLVGTLAANWDKVKEKLGLAKTATNEETTAIKDQKDALDKLNDSLSTNIELNELRNKNRVAGGKSESEILYENTEQAQKSLNALAKEIEGKYSKSISTLTREWEFYNEQLLAGAKYSEEKTKYYEEIGKALKDYQTQLTKVMDLEAKQGGNQGQKTDTKTPTKSTSTTNDDWKSDYEALKQRYKDEETLIDEEYQKQKEKLDKWLKEKKITQDEYNLYELKAYEEMTNAKIELDKECENVMLEERNAARENELQSLSDHIVNLQAVEAQRFINGETKYDEYIKNLEKLDAEYLESYVQILNAQLTAEGITADERLNIERQLNDALIQLAESRKPKDSEIEKQLTDSEILTNAIRGVQTALGDLGVDPAWSNILTRIGEIGAKWDDIKKRIDKGGKDSVSGIMELANAGFGAIGDLMTALGNSYDESTREGFEQSKKYQIASAVMSMLSGIASAWASSMQLMFPANVIVGSALSTMMTALGAVQINKIKETQFDGNGSTSTSSVPTISTNALNTLSQPTMSEAYLTGVNPNVDLNGYVSVVEIERVRNRVGVSENESRY